MNSKLSKAGLRSKILSFKFWLLFFLVIFFMFNVDPVLSYPIFDLESMEREYKKMLCFG